MAVLKVKKVKRGLNRTRFGCALLEEVRCRIRIWMAIGWATSEKGCTFSQEIIRRPKRLWI